MISLFLAMTLTCGQASPPQLEPFANEAFTSEISSTATNLATAGAASGAAQGTDGPKVHARTAYKLGATSAAIRSADELAKLNAKAEDVARALKVDKIDFSKQMLVVISGGPRPTGGYGVEYKSAEVKDKKLVIHWVLKTPAKDAFVTQAFTHPMLVVLMDRFDGDVVFDPAPKVGAGKRPLDRN